MKKISAMFVLVFVTSVSAPIPAQAEEKGMFNFFKKEPKPAASLASESKKPVAAASQAVAAKVAPAVPAAPAGESKPDNVGALTNRMANNKSMTDAEKKGLVDAALAHFPVGADLKTPEFEKDTLRFEQIANDPNMKVNEKKAALEAYFSGAEAAPKTEPVATKVEAPAPPPAEEKEQSQPAVKNAPKAPVAEKPAPVVEEAQKVTEVETPAVVEDKVEAPAPAVTESTATESKEEPKKVKKRNNFA